MSVVAGFMTNGPPLKKMRILGAAIQGWPLLEEQLDCDNWERELFMNIENSRVTCQQT